METPSLTVPGLYSRLGVPELPHFAASHGLLATTEKAETQVDEIKEDGRRELAHDRRRPEKTLHFDEWEEG